MTLNYSEYLQLDRLLELQRPRGNPPEHDEMLFIIVHQVYELWFKQMLHELDRVKQHFAAGSTFEALHTFKRLRMIVKTLVGQLDVLETMTPMSFSSFRDRLETASGFQSTQFRELEFVLGYKRPEVLQHLDASWPGTERARCRMAEPSVVDHFYLYLEHLGAAVPPGRRAPGPPRPTEPDEQVQAGLLRLYRERPEAALLFEQMTDVDEGLQEWRYRHVKLVERTIGAKRGTGGSLGVEFLKQSLFRPVFPDLWAIRHHL
jgi:tryptophan 2,3-dioxygenase